MTNSLLTVIGLYNKWAVAHYDQKKLCNITFLEVTVLGLLIANASGSLQVATVDISGQASLSPLLLTLLVMQISAILVAVTAGMSPMLSDRTKKEAAMQTGIVKRAFKDGPNYGNKNCYWHSGRKTKSVYPMAWGTVSS